MNGLGHHEFGINFKPIDVLNFSFKIEDLMDINFWIKYWINVHEYLIKQELGNNTYLLSYENFCKNPNLLLKKILNINFNVKKFEILNKNKDFKIDDDLSSKAKNLYNIVLNKSLLA